MKKKPIIMVEDTGITIKVVGYGLDKKTNSLRRTSLLRKEDKEDIDFDYYSKHFSELKKEIIKEIDKYPHQKRVSILVSWNTLYREAMENDDWGEYSAIEYVSRQTKDTINSSLLFAVQ